MRHLHFVQSVEPLQGGGLGNAALQLHLELRKKSKSYLIATRARTFDQTWPDVYQGIRYGPNRACFAPDLFHVVNDRIKETDVVHGHGFYVGTNYITGRAAIKNKKPLVYHIHGILDPWILARSRTKKRLAHALFEDANFAYAGLWRALTKKEWQQARDFGIKAPIVIIPNSIQPPPQSFQPLPEQWGKNRERRVLFLARIHPKKGLDLLVAAWQSLSATFPNWELAIVGPDEGGYQKEVEEMISKGGISSSCKIYPVVSGDLKESVLRSADLFILPSYSEGMPIAVLEAAARGIPIVQTTECNFSELSQVGGAWECKPDISELTTTLQIALSSSDEERISRGRVAKEFVESSYLAAHVASQVEEACNNYLFS